jgi:hypothetical protein
MLDAQGRQQPRFPTPSTMATAQKIDGDPIHVESNDGGLAHLHNVDIQNKALANQASEATAQEHSMGVFQALKTYRRAALWSIRESPPETILCGRETANSRTDFW